MKKRYSLSIWLCGLGLWIGAPVVVMLVALLVRTQTSLRLKERQEFSLAMERNRRAQESIEDKIRKLGTYNALAPALQSSKLKGALGEFFEVAADAGLGAGFCDRAISFSDGDPGLFGGVTGKSAQRVTIDVTARMETQLALWTSLESVFPNLRLLALEWTPSSSSRPDGRAGSTNVRAVYLIQTLYVAQTKSRVEQ